MKEISPMADIHSNRVLRISNFKSSSYRSQSSKVLAFLFLQIHPPQTMWHGPPNLPMLMSTQLTLPTSQEINHHWGITQFIPNKLKITTHISLATGQWRKKWSMDSPSALHIQHQLTKMMFLLFKLPAVNIFPRATDQRKKATRGKT